MKTNLNNGGNEKKRNFRSLRVYNKAIDAALEIFILTKGFPHDEKYSMVDQMRRSSRSVCANLAEAWRKRRYKPAFIAKLNDAEAEASETMVWLELAERCGYLENDERVRLDDIFDHIIAQIIRMIQTADQWVISKPN
jgi:four helix bundle protein